LTIGAAKEWYISLAESWPRIRDARRIHSDVVRVVDKHIGVGISLRSVAVVNDVAVDRAIHAWFGGRVGGGYVSHIGIGAALSVCRCRISLSIAIISRAVADGWLLPFVKLGQDASVRQHHGG
jgi:hypothetical protein